MVETEYAKSIADVPMPDNIKALPVCPSRLMPVPWFVSWIDGKPEFRAADANKLVQAIRLSLCWVCGKPRLGELAFVIGPMCSVNRISAEPGCHVACAEYSVKACPFLTKPNMTRREGGMPDFKPEYQAGHMIARNPGAMVVWETKSVHAIKDKQTYLFKIGEPTRVTWYTRGRLATREEVIEAFDSGCPILKELAASEGPHAERKLAEMEKMSRTFFPAA